MAARGIDQRPGCLPTFGATPVKPGNPDRRCAIRVDLAIFSSYAKCVRINFDPAQDKRNLASHGLSLALAETLAWDEALVWVDERFEYDEPRMIGLVPEGNRLYYVAFVDRGKTRRVISLRLAERREVKHYVENYP